MYINAMIMKVNRIHILQVAALAPLALLLVPEARCAHLVIMHLNEFMHDDKTCNERVTLVTKMRVSMTGNCNRNSGAHVQGGWRLDSECLSLPHYLAQSGLSTPLCQSVHLTLGAWLSPVLLEHVFVNFNILCMALFYMIIYY